MSRDDCRCKAWQGRKSKWTDGNRSRRLPRQRPARRCHGAYVL